MSWKTIRKVDNRVGIREAGGPIASLFAGKVLEKMWLGTKQVLQL